jgi:histidyl-tRNA synthetase
VFPTVVRALDAYVVDVTGGDEATALTAELRRAGLRVDRGFDQRSMKSQFKTADRSGALVALLIGADELAEGTVTLRPLREKSGQRAVARTDVVAEVRAYTAEHEATFPAHPSAVPPSRPSD